MRRTDLPHGLFRLGFAFSVVLFGLGFAPRSIAAADIAATTASISVIVSGEVGHPLTLDATALAKLPRVTVQGSDHGVSGSWSGVPLSAILSAAGLPLGEALRGKNMALYVRISAADGYRVVYALAELDPQFRNEPVILADQHDGKALGAKEGPLRVIAPTDQRPARWIRQVTRIDVLRAPDAVDPSR
ncbi:DMSO/TMAO reductase YedYZ molybdopterin-dependent catalytic subunit [Rhodanobacter sp. K2T2]|uniref:molybdopterin-dependent oxidoreductase n=1 Tax=Rhodanobacter sp. K2T2 TaxID=2723085 RepID=UPI0015C9FD74|nr:molybdopterin-dependent oxidoreductase [Rhodanobacter sp. K2T2]NYE28790.1 DMSO/TMAO reductase YedYZ molybdopterin-dependent catalytic subunit [Rhodanobacter sp. K2T2]